jgi:hypothetical protein
LPPLPGGAARRIDQYFGLTKLASKEPHESKAILEKWSTAKSFRTLNDLSDKELQTALQQIEKSQLQALMMNSRQAEQYGELKVERLRQALYVAWISRFLLERAKFDVGESENPILKMSTGAKFAEAMSRSLSKLPGQGWERLKELLTPESIAVMVAFTTAYVVSQTTPIGWVADIIVAGLLAVTVLMLGNEAIEIVKLLIEFSKKASGATSEKDLDEAAELFAKAVSKAGVDIVIAILFHKAGKAANLKPPGPRSPGLIEVLQRGGKKIPTTVLEPAKGGIKVTPDGQAFWVAAEPPSSTLMMEGQSGAGAPKSSGGSGSGKTVTGKGPATDVPQKLAGKNLAAADAVAKKKPPSPSQLLADAKKVVAAEDPTLSPDKPKLTEKTANRPAADEPAKPEAKKETGPQQEKRLLEEDRTSGRPASTATYHAYEGGNRGSFAQWVKGLHGHIEAIWKGQSTAPKLNEAPLGENAHGFIDRHPNLKSAWQKMNLKLDLQVKETLGKKSAAAGDKVNIKRLELIETALERRRAELTDFESGDVGAKRPDLVELFFAERRGVVTDVTQRTGDPLHNFKTEFYIEVVKDVLGWSNVDGVNFNTVYDQNILP